MVDIESEKTTLENRHAKLLGYFKKLKQNRETQREVFLEKAKAYLEPVDLRDSFKQLVADFNKSMNIVLPDPFAAKYDYDFKLFNELKYKVRDSKESITREESKKLQMILDEHLRANGIEYLLEEPIDITDYKKFSEELAKEGQHNPFDKAKAIIKANEEKNPALALELSELIERKLQDVKVDRKQAIQDLFTDIEAITKRHKSKHVSLGLTDERQLKVYEMVGNAELTLEIYDILDDWLHKKAILVQSDAQKEMRNEIKPLLVKQGLDRKLSKEIVTYMVKTYA